MEYGSESGGVWNMALREWMALRVWNMALRVEVCEYGSESGGCVEYGSESGGVWNMALRVEVCGIWL